MPSVWPAPMVHTSLQQSVFLAQTSPVCPQNDDGEHVPLAQRPEQHWELLVHVLPSVLHPVLSGEQVVPLQMPLQHCAPPVQLWPSDVHVGTVHTPLMHAPLQQLVEPEHALRWCNNVCV